MVSNPAANSYSLLKYIIKIQSGRFRTHGLVNLSQCTSTVTSYLNRDRSNPVRDHVFKP